MIFLLFIFTGVMTVLSVKRMNLRFLSPTFWVSMMFAACSLVYILGFNKMLSDISYKTFFVIAGAIIVMALGEISAVGLNTSKKQKTSYIKRPNKEIAISKCVTVILTAVFLIVALVRFRNLWISAEAYSGKKISGLMELLSVARWMIISDSSISLSNVVFNQLVYASEIATYVFLFAYMYNLMLCKKSRLYLLLPLIPDIILRLVTTGRTPFITLIFAIIVIYIYLMQRMNKNPLRVPFKLLLLIILFLIAFFAYGFARNKVSDLSIIEYLQAYTSSALYAFDKFIVNGWDANPYFGYYTLQGIYDLFNIKHSVVPGIKPFMVFSTSGKSSNIYTFLFTTVQDYGIAGMLVLRFIEFFILAKIVHYFVNKETDSAGFYTSIIFAIFALRCCLYAPIEDSITSFFTTPDLMLRYLVYGYIMIKLAIKPHYRAVTSKRLQGYNKNIVRV